MFVWIWIGIAVLALILELTTEQLISIWFVPGAFVGVVLDLLDVGEVWQILVVLVVSMLGLIFLRKLLNGKKQDPSNRTNIDAVIGEKCIVTEKIDNFAGCGQAKVKGQIWSARGLQDDDVFEPGEVLRVVAIEGVKIICKKD